MPTRKDTIFERFLLPFFDTVLLDREALLADRQAIDWDAASDRQRNPHVIYPAYYADQPFHGIEQGYLTPDAAVTYDPITQYVLPPQEQWVRQALLDRIQGQPQRILDLGCGTGSMTLMLKQQYPQATVIGLDLSPYMLVKAAQKAQAAGLEMQFCHGLAEATTFPANSFDLITIALLFHETPPAIAQQILQEAHRLLRPSGEVLILDGHQATLRLTPWLMDIFEEPYIKAYAQGSVDAWLGAAQFGAVRTEAVWGIHQVSRGMKPQAASVPVEAAIATDPPLTPQWVMG